MNNMIGSHEILKEVISTSSKKIAGHLGLSKELIYKWQNGEAKNPIDRVLAISEEKGTNKIIEHLCTMRGGFFVKNTDDLDTSVRVNSIYIKIANLTKVLTESNEDNHLSYNEIVRINCEWNDLQSAVTGLLSEKFKEYMMEDVRKEEC